MFNNPFLKKDPLLEAVKTAQMDGEYRRQAEKIVNEEFGVYSRKAVVRENLAAYDAALEEVYTSLKEGTVTTDAFGTKMTNAGHPNVYHDSDSTSYKASADRMKSGEKAYNPHGTDIKEAKLAKKDYDKDGKIESPKDEVWGSRLRAAKMAGKMEEEQIDEISRDTLKSYVKKADRQANNLERKVERRKDRPGEEDKMYKRIEGANLARKKMGVRVAATEETQIDELTRPKNYQTVQKVNDRADEHDFDYDSSYTRSNRLYRWTKKNYPSKRDTRNQKPTGKTELDDYSHEKNLKRTGGIKKDGVMKKWSQNQLKKDVKGRLGRHTKPNLPEETDYSAQDRAPVTKSPKGYEDPSTPKVPYSELPKTGNRAGAVIDSAKGALKESIIAKINAKHMKEDSSFNAAQETGKSVNEVAMEAPPTPSWVNKPNPGVHRAASRTGGTQRLQGSTYYRGMSAEPQSTKGTGRLVSPQTARATGPLPKTGTSLVPSGNRLPVASTGGGGKPPSVPGGGASSASGGSNLPTSRASGAVTNTQQPIKTTYTKTTTPGVNPPHPSEKIGGFGNFKPAGPSVLSRGMAAGARIAKAAMGPEGAVVAAAAPYLAKAMQQSHQAGHSATPGVSAHASTPGVKASDSFARMKQMAAPKQTSSPAAAPAAKPTVKQSFSQAYKAAREAGGSKAQFKFGDKTYQAAATKKEYVPMSQQKPVDATPKAAPTPPSRPKDLATSSAPAKEVPTIKAPSTPAKVPAPADVEKVKQSFGSMKDLTKDTESAKSAPAIKPEVRTSAPADNTIPGSAAPAKSFDGDTFQKSAPKTKSVNESVQVGTNKYRIL